MADNLIQFIPNEPVEVDPSVLPSAPATVEPRGLGYVYTDDRYAATLYFRRVDRGREPSAELHVHHASKLDGRPLVVASLNLLGAGKKRELTKALTDRAPIVPVWGDIIENACQALLTELRTVRPDPPGDVPPTPQYRPDRIKHLAREDCLNLVYGAGGTGKGWALVYAAMCVQQGVPFLGRPVVQGNVLYLDWEDDRQTFEARVAIIARGTGLAPKKPRYLHCERGLADQLDGVLDYIAEHQIDMVVLDSVSKAFPRGDYASYESTADELAQVARLLPTTLAVAQIAGAGIDSDKLAGKPIGGVGKTNAARVQWEARGHQEDCCLWVALHQTKRNHTAKLAPIAFRLTFDQPEEPTSVVIEPADVRDVPELARHDSIAKRLDEVLRHDKLTYQQMFEELDVPPKDYKQQQVIRITVGRKVREGQYRREGQGRGALYYSPVK
jgi:hypothetical protein